MIHIQKIAPGPPVRIAQHAAHTFTEASHLHEPRLYTEEYTGADKQDHQYVIRKIEVNFLNNA